ncbi:alcohol dehydrogenase [Fusarium acutatum]|uniref:Alcohol dehydrogenase n=1 Tax=Fusarium acutatum TaxID=78861 RepID=A0A8H4JKK9_9HYPO|nr:alcohol dehydrogenase [Fusarium acutatum]
MASWYTGETTRPAFNNKPTPLLSFGRPFPETCLKQVQDRFKSSQDFIIVSRSLPKNTPYVEDIKSVLGERVIHIHVGISPHTPVPEIVDILAVVKPLNIVCIVTPGAGSITAGAKLVRFAIANDAWAEQGIGYKETRDSTNLQPDFAFWCKAKHTFEPGMDPDLSNNDGDAWAARGLEKLISGLLRCKHDLKDLEARHLCQTSVVEVMRAVSSGVPLGASHAIGHQLGPLNVGHGETSCILLPAVCKFNARKSTNNDWQEKQWMFY